MFFSITFSFAARKEKVFGVWKIRKGVLIKNSSKKTELAAHYWKEFYNIFPKDICRKYIREIVLMTDGADEKTGALVALNTKNTQWRLVVDINDVDFKTKNKKRLYESIYTYVHEFGHLLTLNNTQVRPSVKKQQEEGEPYLNEEGQAYKNSYINKFVKRFWRGKLLTEWDVIQDKYCYIEQESCIDKLYDLYMDNFTEFLTDYAAESPEEDVVESWTAFVLKSKIKKPKTIAQHKINFFYQFPELVAFRKHIKLKTRAYLH